MIAAGTSLPPVTRIVGTRDIIMGAAASRDWQPQHHDVDYAHEMNLPGIIMNAPTQTGWFHAFAMGWAGAGGRIARWRLKMSRPVSPGTEVTLVGEVTHCQSAIAGFTWVWLDLRMVAGGEALSAMKVLLCLPLEPDRTCWGIAVEDWLPPALATGFGN